MRDFMYVADSKDEWREYAISNGIAHVETDPEGTMTLVYNEGFHADHIGRVMTDPGEYDNSVFPPVEITPPTYDERFHVNLRVIGDEIEEKFIRLKTYKPQVVSGVEWVEPEQVTTPQRVWLGGMIYFSENVPDDLLICTFPPELNFTTAHLGDLVSVMTPGMWTGNPDLITYQWMRDGVPINQAITPNHTVNILDRDHTLTCRETATNSSGTASVLSNECVVT
jgi:hypothetical protein